MSPFLVAVPIVAALLAVPQLLATGNRAMHAVNVWAEPSRTRQLLVLLALCAALTGDGLLLRWLWTEIAAVAATLHYPATDLCSHAQCEPR